MAPHANLCMPLAFLDVKAINAGRSVRLKSTIKIMICQKLILKAGRDREHYLIKFNC